MYTLTNYTLTNVHIATWSRRPCWSRRTLNPGMAIVERISLVLKSHSGVAAGPAAMPAMA
jgi:hypothetical protein